MDVNTQISSHFMSSTAFASKTFEVLIAAFSSTDGYLGYLSVKFLGGGGVPASPVKLIIKPLWKTSAFQPRVVFFKKP